MRNTLRSVAVTALVALAGAGCQQAPPERDAAGARRSFEDDTWEPAPAAADDSAAGADGTEAEAQAIEQGWQQVRETTDDAARQEQAGELLRRSRELADEPPPQ